MPNFKVNFFKLVKEKNEKSEEMTVTGSEYLGSVTLDDSGVDSRNSLIAIAYRRASPVLQTADKVVVEKL